MQTSDFDTVTLLMQTSDFDTVTLLMQTSDFDTVTLLMQTSDFDTVTLLMQTSDFDIVTLLVQTSVTLLMQTSDFDIVTLLKQDIHRHHTMAKMKTPVSIFIACAFLLSLRSPAVVAKHVVQIPVPTPSHVKYHVSVGNALHNLGHHVWLVAPDFLLEKGVIDTFNVSVIPYKMTQDYPEIVKELFVEAYFSGLGAKVQRVLPMALQICEEILRNKDLEQRIRDVEPDLILLDNTPPVSSLMVIPYKLQVPFAMIGAVYDVHSMMMPYSSAVNPLQMGMTSSDEMTFFERLKSMILHSLQLVYDPFMLGDVVSIYAPERPYISNHELKARPEIWLVEMDHIMDYPRPTLPNVKLIGGTVTENAKPLPPELQAFMDSATHGAVIVTFGGSVLGVPKHISDKLFQVFQDLPFKVVFRSNLTSPDPAKVWTSKWLPQNDLLGHPNTKVFVSHCGKNGQYEALFHAVPLLCTPIFAEQNYNSERIRKKGFGEVVDLRTVTQEVLLTRILTVAQDPGYKLAIFKASTLFRQQYGSPKEEAAKWLDHVMEHGGEYMRYAGQKMPLYQFLGLDVFAFVFALGMMMCMLMYCCVKMLCRCCLKRKSKSD
ncbi:hypothetical protein ACOMHN_056358 [Nucella lapillus]